MNPELPLMHLPCMHSQGLHSKLHERFKGHASFVRPPKGAPLLAFTLRHYAAEVTYDTQGFLEKNKDRCPEDLLVLLRTSRTGLLRVAFAPSAAEQAAMSCKRGARFSGIVSKFGSQLAELNAHASRGGPSPSSQRSRSPPKRRNDVILAAHSP